ncbi:MAG: hypothetical protein GY910_28410 [bacterium]|nr:hypothetical protein [bacterium]
MTLGALSEARELLREIRDNTRPDAGAIGITRKATAGADIRAGDMLVSAGERDRLVGEIDRLNRELADAEREPSGEAFEWVDAHSDQGCLDRGPDVVEMRIGANGHEDVEHYLTPATAREIARNLIRLADYVDAQSKGAE